MNAKPLHVIIPFKGGIFCKSRLSRVLSHRARLELALAMLQHVIRSASHCTPPGRIFLVTSCDQATRLGTSCGANVLRDEGMAGTTAAYRQGLAAIVPGGRVLMLNADLPLVSSRALQRLVEGTQSVTIATDRKRTGTNALMLAANCNVPPCFGPGSLSHHIAAANAADLQWKVFDDPATAFDLDDEADYAALSGVSLPPTAAAPAFCQELRP